MKNLYFALFSILSITISGCSKDTPAPSPVADFSYTGANTTVPATVQFTNNSTNANSYSWDFGDGGTSSDVNPSHNYTAGGVFSVKLTAKGAGGSNTVTKSVTLISAAAPTASFTWTKTSTTAPSIVTFTSTVTNATTYLWDFGDGTTDNTANPVHTYSTGNTYTVSLTVTGTGGSTTFTKGVTILVPTTLQITVSNGSSTATGVSVKLFRTSTDLDAFFSNGTDNSIVTGTTNSNGVAGFTNVTAGSKYFWLATNGCMSSWWNSLDSTVIVANNTNTGSASLDQLETLVIKNTNVFYSAQITINGTINFGYLTTLSAGQSYTLTLPLGTYNIESYDSNNGVTQNFSINLSTCGGTYTQVTNP